jgi:Asp-tRNA(Asn)/Glu-tRNA(Gln) amidotransferase A subunit family amidase
MMTAVELARLIRGRELSAVEVVAAHLAYIEDVNGAINAVVQIAGDRACVEAEAADERLAKGELVGLHGAPFTAKDNFETAGIATAVGVDGPSPRPTAGAEASRLARATTRARARP